MANRGVIYDGTSWMFMLTYGKVNQRTTNSTKALVLSLNTNFHLYFHFPPDHKSHHSFRAWGRKPRGYNVCLVVYVYGIVCATQFIAYGKWRYHQKLPSKRQFHDVSTLYEAVISAINFHMKSFLQKWHFHESVIFLFSLETVTFMLSFHQAP